MTAGMASRPVEERALDEFLAAAVSAPAALLVEGEAGIGKTTVLVSGIARARARGFRVLMSRAVDAQSVLAYAAMADLLADVDPDAWADLPGPQRVAIDRVLQRNDATDAVTDQRAVAAAFLSVVDRLSDNGPVLLAIDDLQWLDPSTVHVIAYAARRLSGPVGLLATVRTERDNGDVAAWLQLPRPEAIQRITVHPLSSRALHAVVSDALRRPIPRAAMARIHQVSAGNPFYAIELARAFNDSAGEILPATLADVVRARIGSFDPAVQDVLLAAACLAGPTVELVREAAATDHERLIGLLETAERHGIITIEGNRIRFTHPLLASGVYADASATQRRRMHRRLAGIVGDLELRARHLALASTNADAETLETLDEAAAAAHARGAPAAAAELLELAIALGGDTPERRIRLAGHSFDAGDPSRARALLERAIATLTPGPLRAEALYSLAIVRFNDDSYPEASQLLQSALAEDQPSDALRVRTLTTLAHTLYNTGDPDTAWRCAEEAVTCAEQLGAPGLLSQALGVRSMLLFLRGDGVDEASLRRALELEDHDSFTPTVLKPSVVHALILGWIGELDTSYRRMQEIQRRCIDRGEEGELTFIDFQVVVNRLWRGDFAEAARVTEAATELANHLGGDFPVMSGLVLKAWLAVFLGEDDARTAASDAIDASKRSGTGWHEEWSITALGFLETSLGNYDAALNALAPLLSRQGRSPYPTEIFAASFVPDAVEALTELGRADEATPLVDALERNGRRLDRAWMLAIGARCRAMVLAAGGELDAALQSAREALAAHDRLPMPFERARTQLLFGQLLRQARSDAIPPLSEALTAFDGLGTRLWAQRARTELANAKPRVPVHKRLTPAEQRVAELAASGMTNRDVAATLFISAKTVEATLARVYRKLEIQSRAELGRHMNSNVT
jgi:DNA-binding CsgD family transcriptional regulator/tetratricopeptide (TPR) repeat protein